MRIFHLYRQLLVAQSVGVLLLAGTVCDPHRAIAQGTDTAAIALALQPGQVVQLVPLGMAPPMVWTIKEKAAGGAITADGKYTAPPVAGTYHVVASPKAAPAKACVFTVVVKAVAVTTVPTTPATPEFAFGAERQYPLPGGGVMRMRYVPAGAFAMGNSEQGDDVEMGIGDERPQHTVTVSGFWIGKCEVTRRMYRQFIQAGGYTKRDYWSPEGWDWRQQVGRVEPDNWAEDAQWGEPPGIFKQTEDHPVIGVNCFEAEAFCRWAGLRLPTEAEWEKAARWDGERSRIYAWGNAWDVTRSNNANDPLYPGAQTAPIGKYPQGASACGCLDMIGNAWEWVSDWYAEDYFATSPGTDPQGPAEGDLRVIKGGSWFGSNFVGADENDRLRAALRVRYDPHNADGGIGFRCALTTMPASAK